MAFFKIKNRQRISVIIPAGAQNGTFFFQYNAKLQNSFDQEVITTGLKCFIRPQLDKDGNEMPGPAVIPQSAAKYCQFTLNSEGTFRIVNMPLTEIMQSQWGGSPVFHQRIPDLFEPLIVDWTKSYVTIAGAPGGTVPAGGAQIVFGVDFLYEQKGALAEYRNQVKRMQSLALSGLK
jgi:hypothetical protein